MDSWIGLMPLLERVEKEEDVFDGTQTGNEQKDDGLGR
jgi:hypothetical protein